MMKITGLSHLFKWDNLHNWWLTKYFFAPLYPSDSTLLLCSRVTYTFVLLCNYTYLHQDSGHEILLDVLRCDMLHSTLGLGDMAKKIFFSYQPIIDRCHIFISFKFKGSFLLPSESCRNQAINCG